MNTGLHLLSDLVDADLDLLLAAGEEVQVIANEVLIREGHEVDALTFVLHGLAGVEVAERQVATLGPGEMLGDLAFLQGHPASATVRAVENSLLLRVPFSALRDALADVAFAGRWYRALAVTAARRLREREARYGQLLAEEGAGGERREGVELRLQELLDGFKTELQAADKAALANGGSLPEEAESVVRSGFAGFVVALDELLGDDCGLPASQRDRLGAEVQREVLPYLLMTKVSERLYAKPRGYAGDFLSIDWIYANEARGAGRLGPVLDRCFLDEPAAQAVRNRRGLLRRRIEAHLAEHPERPVRITTMACGPAREVFDVFATLPDPTRLEATLIDIDAEALDQVRADVEAKGLGDQIRLHQANLVYLALGRERLDLAEQDLVYSIGLIDYFNDKLVGKLMDYGHALLREGGEIVLGNFHPANRCKALMDYVLDWRLIHRDEADMDRLYTASAFGQSCTAVRFEEANVNLFASCRKRPASEPAQAAASGQSQAKVPAVVSP